MTDKKEVMKILNELAYCLASEGEVESKPAYITALQFAVKTVDRYGYLVSLDEDDSVKYGEYR